MYTYDARIRYSEIDENGFLTIDKLTDYFQDCSTFQSEDLGVGVDYLKQFHLAWVINIWQIEVLRYPKYCEKVIVGTFPYEFKSFLGYRNFFMKDMDGNFLAKANTIWTLLNLDTFKPQKPGDEHRAKYVVEDRLDMTYRPRKIPVPADLKQGEAIEIKKHHLDTSHHVNNGQYIKIAMDSADIIKQPSRFRCEYKKQAFSGDVLTPYIGKGACEDGRQSDIIELRNQENEACFTIEFD